MNKFLTHTLLLFALIFSTSLLYGQYIPATDSEVMYDNLILTSSTYNEVGTDTRDGSSTGYGYGSPLYANYLNVTVNSTQGIGTFGAPGFYWESSFGTSGSSPLPSDALDPDVVLVSPGGDAAPADIDRVWAIAVYYSDSIGGYCMSIAEFVAGPNSFTPMSPAILIQPFIPSGFDPHINIDSDNYGRYAVVMQLNGGIQSRTQTLYTTPTIPVNAIWQPGLVEPDIACLGNSAYQSNIVALNNARDQYFVDSRPYLAGPSFNLYASPTMPDLQQPRIAAPPVGTMSEYAVTLGRKYTVGANTLYDIILNVNSGGPLYMNTGAIGFPPGIQLNNPNSFPCVTYSPCTSCGASTHQISLGWWVDAISGLPNQPFTFIGLDIDPSTMTPNTPSNYQDISNANGGNNESAMAISGRFTSYAKTAAFTYGTGSPLTPSNLMWKISSAFLAHWKQAAGQSLDKEAASLYPNPAGTQVHLALNNIEDGYSFSLANQLGQTLHRGQMNSAEVTIALDQWPAGLYFVKVINETTQEVQNLKFIKH